MPSNSAAVHGFRYNARVLAEHIAGVHFGIQKPSAPIERDRVVAHLLDEVTSSPELRNQQSYLASVVVFDPSTGPVSGGIVPLAHFVDESGPDSVAVVVETDDTGDIHPA